MWSFVGLRRRLRRRRPGLVSAHAVYGRLLFEGGHLSVGSGSTKGQHVGEGVLRCCQEEVQAGHLESSHVVRVKEGAGKDE